MRNRAIERPQKIELYARNADSSSVICTSRSRNPVIRFIVTTDKSICSLSHILNVLDVRPVSRDSMDTYLRNDSRWRNILQVKLRWWYVLQFCIALLYLYFIYHSIHIRFNNWIIQGLILKSENRDFFIMKWFDKIQKWTTINMRL